jgi:hypothetical protein
LMPSKTETRHCRTCGRDRTGLTTTADDMPDHVRVSWCYCWQCLTCGWMLRDGAWEPPPRVTYEYEADDGEAPTRG